MRRHTRLPKLIASALLALVLSGCSPEFWEAAASGYAATYQPANSYNQSAGEKARVCVRYETQYGWSKGYSVEGTIIKGKDLNRTTGTYKYNYSSTYVVVFWGQNEASILELQYFTGTLSHIQVSAKDQQKRNWKVAKTSYCV